MVIGSIIGSYIPVLFGAGLFSYISILFSGIGGILGIWIGLKLITRSGFFLLWLFLFFF